MFCGSKKTLASKRADGRSDLRREIADIGLYPRADHDLPPAPALPRRLRRAGRSVGAGASRRRRGTIGRGDGRDEVIVAIRGSVLIIRPVERNSLPWMAK